MAFTADRYVAALQFAGVRHGAQRMPHPDVPYVVHVCSVAAEVIAGLERESLPDGDLAVTCALLHDTIEDTETTYDDVVAAFGRAVGDGVLALSKDKQLATADQLADSLRRIQLQPPEVWAVKLADRIVNLGPPPPKWPADKRRAYRAEGYKIADVLGSAHGYLGARLRDRADRYAAYIG
nr:HD domain-containing protein [Kofleriaceae bacterium]